ncbi:MAG: hypothetical protein ABI921_13660 [Panacibacter sp.]
MKTSSASEIKQELINTPPKQLIELCLQLAKYKKENKELLTYLLFESHDIEAYINNVKADIDEQFENVNKTNLYFAKKSLRKILRVTSKYIRHTGSKQAEAELLIYFCNALKNSGITLRKSAALTNLYNQQIKKINKAIDTMHEDLQHDYLKEIKKLE